MTKSGYTVTMGGAARHRPRRRPATVLAANTAATGYHATANPVTAATGTRYFATDTRGTICRSTATLRRITDTAASAAPARRSS